MRQVAIFCNDLQPSYGFFVANNVGEKNGPVFLNPGQSVTYDMMCFVESDHGLERCDLCMHDLPWEFVV